MIQKIKLVVFLVILILGVNSCGNLIRENKMFVEDDGVSDELAVESMKEEEADAESDKKKDSSTKDLKTWKRSNKEVNQIKLFVGDNEELQLKGTQYTIKVDGFRARVLIDCYFYNDRDFQMEGTFKIRLPNGASPYFLAFGKSVFINENQQQNQQIQFQKYENSDTTSFTAEQILNMNSSSWTQPKTARIVPKEKAAFAYTKTVQRQVDPALAEWAGADIFNCRIFPLSPKTVHKIVFAYDVNLTNIGNDKVFDFNIPQNEPTTMLSIDAAEISGKNLKLSNFKDVSSENNRKLAYAKNPEFKNFSLRYSNLTNVLLSSEGENESYFAANISANLPKTSSSISNENAIILIDISASSNPDKFNIWLKMTEAILKNNLNVIKKFKVVFFNIESFWWKEEFVENNTANISSLMSYCNNINLQGASDISSALQLASSVKGKNNLFLLSDGSSTWGDDELYSLSSKINKTSSLFAYNTGISGSDKNMLNHLTRESGGTVFSISGEDEIKQASKAFRNLAWKIKSIKMNNCSDIIIAGRPKYVYPQQKLNIAGRGFAPKGSILEIVFEQKGKIKKMNIKFNDFINSNFAKRIYGQIAVNQLESFDFASEKFSIPYAVHYEIPGKTCSMLMLETEEDYKQFDIKNKDNYSVIKANSVNNIISKILNDFSEILGNAKIAFLNQISKLKDLQGVNYKASATVEEILKEIPDNSFVVNPKALSSKKKSQNGFSEIILQELKNSKPTYDIIVNEAFNLKTKFSADDALIFLSTLVERNPSDGVMARDIAYSAMEWGLSEQAYYLFKRVLKSRPHEPQTYHAIANILSEMGKIDLAVMYYEIAISANWDGRFGDFKNIAAIDYLRLLRQIKAGKYTVSFPNKIDFLIEKAEQIINIKDIDIMIVIAWNTDNTDIDLHVIDPTGEECFYSHPKTKIGGTLTKDVTQGYGPEMYVLPKAKSGKYEIKAKYFSSNRNRASTRTKVYATIYENWGKKNEKITKKVVSLADNKEMHKILSLNIQ